MPTNTLPPTGFLRLPQIIGDRKAGIPALIPMGKSKWWEGVRRGEYPAGIKLGHRTTVWRVEDIRDLIERLSQQAA